VRNRIPAPGIAHGFDARDQIPHPAGGNLFLGENDWTFFGQFEDNSNLYAAVRYAF